MPVLSLLVLSSSFPFQLLFDVSVSLRDLLADGCWCIVSSKLSAGATQSVLSVIVWRFSYVSAKSCPTIHLLTLQQVSLVKVCHRAQPYQWEVHYFTLPHYFQRDPIMEQKNIKLYELLVWHVMNSCISLNFFNFLVARTDSSDLVAAYREWTPWCATKISQAKI